MKSLKMLKSILKIGAIAILLFSIHNTAFGASSITISPGNETVSTGDNSTPTGIEITPTNNTNNTNNTTAKNTTNKTNTTLPKTGIEDNAILFVVLAVCGVSAIYAYKKVSDFRRL